MLFYVLSVTFALANSAGNDSAPERGGDRQSALHLAFGKRGLPCQMCTDSSPQAGSRKKQRPPTSRVPLGIVFLGCFDFIPEQMVLQKALAGPTDAIIEFVSASACFSGTAGCASCSLAFGSFQFFTQKSRARVWPFDSPPPRCRTLLCRTTICFSIYPEAPARSVLALQGLPRFLNKR